MIKVECPSCSAPYDLDERRLPASGVKMRCPKCASTFRVFPSGEVGDAGAAPKAPAPPPTKSVRKMTVAGVAPPVPTPGAPVPPRAKETARAFDAAKPAAKMPFSGLKPPGGLPDPRSNQKTPPREFAAPSPNDVALPAPKGRRAQAPRRPVAPQHPTKPRAPAVRPSDKKTPAAPFPGVGLPAPVVKGAAGPGFSGPGGGAALPAPKKAPLAPAFPGAGVPKATPAPAFDELDLPAPKGAVGLPAPKAPPTPAFPGARGAAKTPAAGLPAPKAPLAPPFPGARAGAETPAAGLPAPKLPSPAMDDELSFAGLDLPAPKAPSHAVDDEMSFAGLDLPAPKGAGADLPAPKAPSPALDDEMSFAGLDLPAPKGAGADLPAPKTPSPALDDEMSFADLDLPAPKGAGVDLPAPKGAGADLPAPKGAGADLPAPKGASADLPAPKGASADLPVPKGAGGIGFGDLDLPTPKAGAGAAGLGGDLLGDLDLPPPQSAGGVGAGDLFGDLDLPTPKGAAAGLPVAKGTADLPVPRDEGDLFGGAEAGGSGFGELDLPGIDDGFDDLDLLGSMPAPGPGGPDAAAGGGQGGHGGSELDLPLPGDELGGAETSDGRAGAGGVGFGEIDLGEEGGDGMEFGDLPQERDGSVPARVSQASIDVVKDERTRDREARERDAETAGGGEAPRSKLPFLVLGLVVLIAGLGVGGGFMPGIGYFGIYLAEQLLPEAGDAGAVQAAVTSAEEEASSDTYDGVRASLRTLADARNGMGLNRPLLARSLVHEGLFLARFGDDPASAGRADNIRRRLEERGYEGADMLLADAATALATGADGASQARGLADQARGSLPDDPYVDLVAAEGALLQGDPEAARELFAAALTKGGGARAQWGLARALLALGSDEASEAVDATLDASRRHAEARVAKATLLFAAENITAAKTLAQEAAGVLDVGDARLRTTPLVRSAAFTLMGRIAEREGNRRDAREAYEAAVEANAFGVQALVGAGRAHLADERWRDALTNFEAAIDTAANNGEPTAIDVAEGQLPLVAEARLGAARAMFRLDRELDAKRTLEQLVEAYPESGAVSLWLGRVSEALDDAAGAEARYREAIVLSPDSFEPYLALAHLFFDSDRHEAAGEVLTQARERVEESAVMRRLLGESELGRRRYDDAALEFERALELDPADIAARYGLGVAHRRSGDLDAANVAFAQVAEVDPTWPGLALERGLVFEARGESDEAVRAYTLALEGRPDDPDLLLRLGAAYVSDGRVDEAEETLRRVQESRPNSAEVEHFMGRVELERGNLPVAVNHFSRSIALDATRGEFHLYVAWAALEMSSLARALSEVNAAIELDPSLGDAFWIRGRIRLRGGAVRDALDDLRRALELKPSRYEAYAAMAECYDGLRRIPEAIEAYKRALERDNSKGQWWYRLGRLQLDAGRRTEAVPSLERATLIGGALEDPPAWLSDAHRLLGDILRTSNRTEAIAHYRRYLEVASDNALDRNHVRDVLMDMGESP
ncbi:MAG: hypothetical protein DRJ42_19790 [Deltaproteobacteria bacterium]|nr:MAG: hypothetical protein DRJ42_19790 [Deltaproteobacteria bacterium]